MGIDYPIYFLTSDFQVENLKQGEEKRHQKFTKNVGPAIMWLIESQDQEAGGVIAKTSFSFERL